MTSSPAPAVDTGRDNAQWPIAGLFLDALARRDFGAMTACLAPDVHFRALVPPGGLDSSGPDATISHFRRWFDGKPGFEIVDASIGQVGPRLYLRWRVRVAAPGDPDSALLVEQHVFVTATTHIESVDLLCSGFQPD
jgi:hypothetical protein